MRAKVSERAEPWFSGWSRLAANKHADLAWTPRAVPVVYRGFDKIHPENYSLLFNDAAAAYACALRWKVSGETAYADKAVEILDAWAGTLASIQGTSDRFLASGIYGYELANAAEIIRSYPGWTEERFFRFRKMMLEVFYPMNHDFLVHHNGAKIDHYWANWDLCNMASLLSIGVLADRRDIYDETLAYFRDGAGNGSIRNVVSVLYPDVGLGQWQESGRDQGHCLMGIGILGAICEMAWNQGDDLYGYDDNRFLKGAEYVAKYNLGLDVPYTSYQNSDVTQPVISDKGRGEMRPSWELVYNHYVRRKGLKAPFVEQMAAKVRPEGGGGDYGPKSGGFDQLGYGTLTATLESSTSPR
ncbi:MAG TPA: alginate lyase family protein [Candidatus Methylacidiphilales bacterium]